MSCGARPRIVDRHATVILDALMIEQVARRVI
jgi:hypothetical protein